MFIFAYQFPHQQLSMNNSTLELFEQKADLEAYEAHKMCDEFAEEYELPTDYIYMEFVNPTVDSLEAVTKALDIGALFIYNWPMNKTDQERAKMAQTLSKAYDWDLDELMVMDYDSLSAVYSERYLDYIYGV